MKQMYKKASFQNICNVNIAVGHIAIGRNDEALEILTHNINTEIKSNKTFQVVYHLALFCCYLNIRNLEKATFEYDNYLKELRKDIMIPYAIFAIDASVLEYQFMLNKSTDMAKIFMEQLDYLYNTYAKKINKRGKLHVIYNKACLLLELGDSENAKEKFMPWLKTETYFGL